MANAEAVIDRFMVPYAPEYAPNHGQFARTTVICADERTALLRGAALSVNAGGRHYETLRRGNSRASDARYLRTIAGAVGVGTDMHVTMRVLEQRAQRRNSGTARYTVNPAVKEANARSMAETYGTVSKIPQVHILGSTAAKAASVEGIDLCTHVGCAGEDGAEPISTGIANNTGRKGENLREVLTPHWQGNGNFGELWQEIQEAFAAGMDDGMVAPLGESKPLLDEGNLHEGGALQPVARVPLVDMPHVSDTLIVDWGTGRTLDAEAATQATREAGEVWTHYYANVGAVSEIVGRVVTDHILDVDPAEFQTVFTAVSFARNGSSSLWLPEQQGQSPSLYALAA